jgi:hypothetical protein
MIDDPLIAQAQVREPEQPPTEVVIPPATQEQAHVVDSVFTRHSNEASVAAGLLGLQVGVMVLRDLAIEAVERSPEEEEEERRRLLREGEPGA